MEFGMSIFAILPKKIIIDFFTSWGMVILLLVLFIIYIQYMVADKTKEREYVSKLEEENYFLKEQNIDLRYQLRDFMLKRRGLRDVMD
jgi:energy-coupling factor transporter transmembrane protein EcfT